jgi:hypothetical protein
MKVVTAGLMEPVSSDAEVVIAVTIEKSVTPRPINVMASEAKQSPVIQRSAKRVSKDERPQAGPPIRRGSLAPLDDGLQICVHILAALCRISARRFRIAGDISESQIFLSMIEDRTEETRAA